MALDAGTRILEAVSADGDPTNEIRSLGTIVDRGWTTLGRYPAYVDTASRLQTDVFNIPAHEWELLSRAEQWQVNQQFLDASIARGDVFLLSTPFVEGIAAEGSFFQRELLYLLDRGYQIVTIQGQDWLLPSN